MISKSQLIDIIADNIDVTKKDIKLVLNTFQDIVKHEVVVNDEDVILAGFMTFYKKHIPERTGKSNLTGERWIKPEQDCVAVRVAKGYSTIL